MLSQRTSNADFQAKIAQMALQLTPLVRVTSGEVHPYFPTTLLNFWVLTSDQLDDLAHFYHQRTPCEISAHYPCPVIWSKELGLEDKRRKIGRFIGLRGCETPIQTDEQIMQEIRERGRWEAHEELLWGRKGWFG